MAAHSDVNPPTSTPTTITSVSDPTSPSSTSNATSTSAVYTQSLWTTTVTLPNDVPTDAYSCADYGAFTVYCLDISGTARVITTESSPAGAIVSNTVIRVLTSDEPSLAGAPTISTVSTSSSSSSSSSSRQPMSESTTSSVSSTTSSSQTGTAAQANATSSSLVDASPSSKSNTGAVAGAAVGCFLAGLILAGLIAYFLMRKRKNERYARPANYTPAPIHSYGEKGTPMVAVSSVAPDFLPQQADDAEVRHRISTVIDQIDQHVENFYVNQTTQLTPHVEAELSRFETSLLPYALASCFQRSSQPTVLIKHCLAFHTFNLTMAPGEGTTPILPPDIANMLGMLYGRSVSPQVSREFISAFSSWKRLTSFLRPDLLRDPNALNKSTEASTRIANHFTDIFTPWRNESYSDDQRARHLSELLDHAVHTAIWLFGQPDSYRFGWTAPKAADMGRSVSIRGREAERIVVAPEVTKVTHGGAKLPGAGQQVLPAVTKRI